MKKTEKNNFEKIKEKIGKETGYIIKNNINNILYNIIKCSILFNN